MNLKIPLGVRQPDGTIRPAGIRQADGTIRPICGFHPACVEAKPVKTTMQFVGGPLDGTTTFDYRPMTNPNLCGFAEGSVEFFRWLAYDLAIVTNGGIVGFVSGGMTPADYQRRLAGEKDFQAQGCNYELVQRDEKNGGVFVKFQCLDT